MSAIYRDPATGWLYRVSPQPEHGSYVMQYRDPANSATWKWCANWNIGNIYREILEEVLEARAKRDGWELVSGPASSEPPEVVDEGEEYSPCDTCRCPDCIDRSCPQAGCDKTDGGFGCFAPYEECPAPAEETCQDERLVKDKTSSCPYFSGVTSHLIGSRRIENVNCKQQDHPLSIACYTFGCKDAVEECRIYWLGQIDEELGHRVPEHLFKDGSANDLRAYLEEEIEKCKNQSAPNGDAAATTAGSAVPEPAETSTTPTDANTLPAPGCPADAGSATQSLSAAGPASLEAEPEATPFDYSGLDAQTVATLHSAENIIRSARKEYVIKVADAVGMAHDELVRNSDNSKYGKRGEDTFINWCNFVGISRSTAYQLLQVSDLLESSTPNEQKILKQASPSLLYAAARPSAEPEAVAALKGGDITTHKQYKELEAQLKAEREAREKAAAEVERLRYANDALRDEAATARAQAKHAQEKADALETRPVMSELFDAKERIKELEARPVEVAVQEPDPAEVERRAAARAETMTAQLRGELKTAQHNIRQMQDRTQSLLDQLEDARNASASRQLPSPDEAFETAFPMAKDFAGGIRTYHKTFLMVAPGLAPVDLKTCAQLMIDAAQELIAGLRAVMTLPEPVEGDEDFD